MSRSWPMNNFEETDSLYQIFTIKPSLFAV